MTCAKPVGLLRVFYPRFCKRRKYEISKFTPIVPKTLHTHILLITQQETDSTCPNYSL